MITKKSLRIALKFALQADGFACGTCREEMKVLIENIGKAMKTGEDTTFNVKVEGGHLVYQTPAASHSGPEVKPERKKRKKAKSAEGSEAEAESEDEAEDESD